MVPFEWLSSPDIVIESIESCFNNAADKKFHVVDFGSGSSLLAIKLLRTHARHVDKVSNLDYNAEALSIALNNMSDDDQINLSQGKIKYHCINLARSFTAEQYEMILKHKNHHACPVLVLDKSTLDCFLATPNIKRSGARTNLPYFDAATMLYNVHTTLTYAVKFWEENTQASHSKYICCSYHEPKFLQPILSILFNVCDSKVVKRCENRSGDRVKSCSMESSDPNFVYLYVCVPIFEGKEDQKSIGCIRTEIEMYIDNYYKHTATYSSTIDQIDLRLRWENLVESELFIKNDGLYSQASTHGDLQKLPIDKVYNLVIDDKLQSMYSINDFREDWLSKNSNATGRETDAITMNLAEAIAFIKNIE